MSRKDFVRAEKWMGWSRYLSPKNANVQFLDAQLSRRQGHFEEMSILLQAAAKLGFDKQKLEHEQDLAMAAIGRFEEGVEERIQTRLEQNPPDADQILEAYANGLSVLSRFDEAITMLQIWEKTSPDDSLVNYRRARIHEHFHQTDEAELQYREALKKDPNFKKAKFHLARLLLQLRHPEEALKLYQECDEASVKIASTIGIANCYRTLGDLEKSRDMLRAVMSHSYDEVEKSYATFDEHPERYFGASELGCIETELGEFAEAKRHLELALDRFPLDSVGRYSYAVALRGLGLKEEAEKNFEITRAARAALDEVSTLQEILRKDPQDTAARLKIGKIILQHESERTGVFWIRSIFAYDPKNQEAHRTLAEYFEGLKKPTEEQQKLAEFHRSFVTGQTN